MLKAKAKNEFIILARENMKRAFNSALGILGSYDDAADVSQEAFIRAYNNFHKFDSSKKFFTWYYKILRNLCLNKIRDSKRLKEVFLEERVSDEDDIETSIEADEEKNKLSEAIMKLEAGDREIIILREFENYSYDEISEMLEIPKGSVMSRLYYARKKLAKLFLESYE